MPQFTAITPSISHDAFIQLSHGSIPGVKAICGFYTADADLCCFSLSLKEASFPFMHGLFALAAPLALMLPMVSESNSAPNYADDSVMLSAPQCEAAAAQGSPMPVNPLSVLRTHATARQVRIEQRVVVRIVPQSLANRQNMLAALPQRDLGPRFEERSKEKCVDLQGIAGVQTGSGNRLVLFLRDQRMISVNLEKSCRARDFYSGFYVEQNKDGRLCVDRDKLHSRTGARCEVATMRQLVEARE